MSDCPIKPGVECWDCIECFKKVVQLSSTGATIHYLNNKLVILQYACVNGNKEQYYSTIQTILTRIKEG